MEIKKQYQSMSDRTDLIKPRVPHHTSIRDQTKESVLKNVGARLARRKQLFRKRKFVSDACVLVALLGILLMIIEIELIIFRTQQKYATTSYAGNEVIKILISISTGLLIFLLLWFHKCDVQLFMIDNGMDDWRLAMSLGRVLVISLEVIICSIHPIPGNHDLNLMNLKSKSESVKMDPTGKHANHLKVSIVPIDILLALPMFLRFYLVCRCLMLHSRLFQDASAQSLGALNRIHFNFSFIFKSLMNLYAEYVLTIMISFLFLWASWAVRACETYHSDRKIDFFDSMWLIAITFLTVGYGDLVPESTCGKSIAVLTGIFGVGCTALVVAVLARKLELSRAEMYVHNFVIGVELAKQMKHAAANIVKEGWLVHKYRRQGWVQRALKHERRLLQAIRRIRELKNDQSRVSDNSLSMLEIYRSQIYLQKSLEHTQTLIQEIHDKLHA